MGPQGVHTLCRSLTGLIWCGCHHYCSFRGLPRQKRSRERKGHDFMLTRAARLFMESSSLSLSSPCLYLFYSSSVQLEFEFELCLFIFGRFKILHLARLCLFDELNFPKH